MFNKFKIGEIVLCCGIGKVTEKQVNRIGRIIEKDYYYKDYCIKFDDDSEEWLDENSIYKINLVDGGKEEWDI